MLRFVLLGLCVSAAGCGDALPPTEFAGEPLFTHGDFLRSLSADQAVETPRYAFFFLDEKRQHYELSSSTRPFTRGADTLRIFSTPPDSVLHTTDGGGRYGMGMLRSYADENNNGRKDKEESFLGAAQLGVMYMPTALDAASSPTGVALPAGYIQAELPPPCMRAERGDSDCGVPLGATCRNGDDCGEGQCEKEAPFWLSGYCVLPAREGGCAPANGAKRVVGSMDSKLLWLQACDSHADCSPDPPHYCERTSGVCLPDHGYQLDLQRPGNSDFCVGPPTN